MKLYKVLKEKNDYFAFEIQSEQKIKKYKTYEEASKFCKKMNGGNFGFAGWTPSFMIKL